MKTLEKTPILVEQYADNGEFSHLHLIEQETGEVLWSSFPKETIAKGQKIKSIFGGIDNPITDFSVHQSTMGCIRHKTDIMIGFRVEGNDEFNDIFLTTEQAEALITKLQNKLTEHKKEKIRNK